MSTTTVLVPLDGSRFGEFAVPAAMSVARELQAQIELISVFEEQSVLAGSEPTTQQFKVWLTGGAVCRGSCWEVLPTRFCGLPLFRFS